MHKKRQATADARVRSLFVTTMAAAPPAAGATPGTPHTTTTTATMAAHSITTYAEHYAALPDDLQGRYDRLLAPYDPASGRLHQQLLHRLLSMSDTSPKAFVGLVEHSGSYCTVLVHRITLFKSHPVDVSDWDGKALGFGGDVMPGNHIELMEVPEDAFAVAQEHVVPTRENVTHLLSGNPTAEVLGPFTAGDPDTEPLKCRKMVPVPAAYLHLLLDRTLTPRQLWEQVGGAIIADAKEVECGVLLNWIRAALTARSSTTTPPPPPPATLASPMIQFPPEMDENWVRYGLAKLGQISELPNWQRMLFCAYTTQLLHSTGEVCWNNKDSYFIWFEFVCRNSGQIASRRSWKRSCLGLEYTSKCSRLALLWEPN